MADTYSFTSTGRKVRNSRGGKVTPLGREINGKVYQHPRLKLDPLAGSNVVVTNPKAAATPVSRQRTTSLGMGGVGQRGRTYDF
jgi:hypothetical protein